MIIHSACHVSQLNPVSGLCSLTSMFCLASKCLPLLLPLLPVNPWCVIFLVALLKFSCVILKLTLRFRFGIRLFPRLSAHPLTDCRMSWPVIFQTLIILFYMTDKIVLCAKIANNVSLHEPCRSTDWSNCIEGITVLWSVTRAPRPFLSLSFQQSKQLNFEYHAHIKMQGHTRPGVRCWMAFLSQSTPQKTVCFHSLAHRKKKLLLWRGKPADSNSFNLVSVICNCSELTLDLRLRVKQETALIRVMINRD